MALPPGSTLGPYRIVEPLGKGGMASVYKAYEPALDRYVALKVLPGEFLHDETFGERFHREAKVIARLEHPHIVPIHAFGIEEGAPWMAMRLITGGSLASLMCGKRIAASHAVTLLRGVAAALDYAHGKGVIHRDVKPQNILLDEGQHTYLADFGIARIVEGSSALTHTGMITGTPQYMAPEQAMGEPIDPRVDIYALGIVAYEMLIGRVPFSADTPVAVLIKHVQEPMPLPGGGEISESVARALLRSVAKKREDRWDSACAFVEALERGATAVSAAAIAPTGTMAALWLGAPPPILTSAVPAPEPRTDAGLRPTWPPPPPTPQALPALPPPVPVGHAVRPPPPPTTDARTMPPPPPSPAPTPSAGSSRWRSFAGIGALILLVAGGFLAARHFAGPPSATAPSDEKRTEAPEAAKSGSPGSQGESAGKDDDRSAREPEPSPTTAKSRVVVDFEHPLKAGSLSLWVDQRLVLSEKLLGRVSQDLLAFKLRKGHLDGTVNVSPGTHVIRVQVRWDDNIKTETISGVFRAGGRHRLQIRLGRIRKNLSLQWV
jgi:tRNA A-37 threonylcarbamoyl transferase component Bud32